MKRKKYGIHLFIAVSIAVCSVFFLSADNKDFKIIKNIDIFISLYKELNKYYVDEVDSDKLIKTAIDKMLESIDPYTTYIPESELENFEFMTTGKYGGIGAMIKEKDDYIAVTNLYRNFPADKYGLKVGDLIIEVGGVSTKGKKVSDVSDILKGTPETTVEVKIKRPGTEDEIKKTIIREKISISNIPYYGMINDETGYIRLSGFTEYVSNEVRKALDDLKNNHNAKSFILDLRDNPGGLLDEAINVVGLFVHKGQEVVSTKGRMSIENSIYTTTHHPFDTTSPLVVLVSRASASASEIVAGAIQDVDRGVIIGTRTFGKGLVQRTFPLSYNSLLKVTISKYYIPSGRCIQAVDYSHRNPDGSVGNIPDSLIHEFKTQNGRKVYDGGGIAPDISINPDTMSRIAIGLYTEDIIFDYATKYALKHDSVPIEDFVFSDEDYESFIAFAKTKEFDYKTLSGELLQQLTDVAKKEQYYEHAKQEIEALKEKLGHNKEKDMRIFKEEISQLLSSEIITRYHYNEGGIRYSLTLDKEVAAASELLKDTVQYRKILNK